MLSALRSTARSRLPKVRPTFAPGGAEARKRNFPLLLDNPIRTSPTRLLLE